MAIFCPSSDRHPLLPHFFHSLITRLLTLVSIPTTISSSSTKDPVFSEKHRFHSVTGSSLTSDDTVQMCQTGSHGPSCLVPAFFLSLSLATSQDLYTLARWNLNLFKVPCFFTFKFVHMLFPLPGTFCFLCPFTC